MPFLIEIVLWGVEEGAPGSTTLRESYSNNIKKSNQFI